jgi:hypothetical protein
MEDEDLRRPDQPHGPKLVDFAVRGEEFGEGGGGKGEEGGREVRVWVQRARNVPAPVEILKSLSLSFLPCELSTNMTFEKLWQLHQMRAYALVTLGHSARRTRTSLKGSFPRWV